MSNAVPFDFETPAVFYSLVQVPISTSDQEWNFLFLLDVAVKNLFHQRIPQFSTVTGLLSGMREEPALSRRENTANRNVIRWRGTGKVTTQESKLIVLCGIRLLNSENNAQEKLGIAFLAVALCLRI